MSTGNTKGLQTTKTSIRVIRALERLDGAGVSQLADKLGLAPSTVHSHLQTLLREELLVQEGDVYYLSLEFLRLGEYVRKRRPNYRLIQEKLEDLAAETHDRALFTVEEHGKGRYVAASAGEKAIQTYSDVGKQSYLHVSAGGKSILSTLPTDRVEEIIAEHGLPPATENTITDRDELFEELEEIRNCGYALNRVEHIKGIKAVGAPVKDPIGQVIGALVVSGPVHRMQGARFEDELPTIVRGAADEVELQLEYS